MGMMGMGGMGMMGLDLGAAKLVKSNLAENKKYSRSSRGARHGAAGHCTAYLRGDGGDAKELLFNSGSMFDFASTVMILYPSTCSAETFHSLPEKSRKVVGNKRVRNHFVGIDKMIACYFSKCFVER